MWRLAHSGGVLIAATAALCAASAATAPSAAARRWVLRRPRVHVDQQSRGGRLRRRPCVYGGRLGCRVRLDCGGELGREALAGGPLTHAGAGDDHRAGRRRAPTRTPARRSGSRIRARSSPVLGWLWRSIGMAGTGSFSEWRSPERWPICHPSRVPRRTPAWRWAVGGRTTSTGPCSPSAGTGSGGRRCGCAPPRARRRSR